MSSSKPPSRTQAPGAAPAAARRPGFPARLDAVVAPPGRAAAAPAPAAARAVAKPVIAPVRGVGMDSEAVRAHMVQKLAAQGIQDAMVLGAMGRVERHRFVDSALVGQAYEDTSLPIGLGQTISKPSVVARMLALLLQGRSQPLGRVLEIGTGCGYQAAVLAQLAGEVYSIERLRGLHDKARENVRPLRLPNLHLLFGDGMLGYAKGAPYAAIIAAAGGEAVPAAWVEQLAVGGRLVAPIHVDASAQALMVIDKTPQGLVQNVLEAVHFVPLKSGIQ